MPARLSLVNSVHSFVYILVSELDAAAVEEAAGTEETTNSWKGTTSFFPCTITSLINFSRSAMRVRPSTVIVSGTRPCMRRSRTIPTQSNWIPPGRCTEKVTLGFDELECELDLVDDGCKELIIRTAPARAADAPTALFPPTTPWFAALLPMLLAAAAALAFNMPSRFGAAALTAEAGGDGAPLDVVAMGCGLGEGDSFRGSFAGRIDCGVL